MATTPNQGAVPNAEELIMKASTNDLSSVVSTLLEEPRVLDEMEALSRSGRPAVQAIGKRVGALVPDLDDTGKQNVGRLVRTALAGRGWKPGRKARVAPGHFFSWGAVYRHAGLPVKADTGGAPARMAALREMVRSLPGDPPSVDEFLEARNAIWGQ